MRNGKGNNPFCPPRRTELGKGMPRDNNVIDTEMLKGFLNPLRQSSDWQSSISNEMPLYRTTICLS